ncbi:MAG: 2,3-bisphosphoglycerate-independent phosphoglycerate mutase [Saprospiraceae bacterium]|jgi:2,3-bisphosphoglycerate-independent phosphoglycerate mutase
MSLVLEKLSSFQGRKGPLLLIVMDGVGVAPDGEGNAVTRANTPTLDRIFTGALSSTLKTHGIAVGLPDDEDMGNSEVGHNALGAGRVIAQGASLVNNALKDGSLYQNPHWLNTMSRCAAGGTLHFLGLLSDGNVHSSITHLFSLVAAAKKHGVQKARFHVLLDGRDVAPRSALTYLLQLEQQLVDINAEGFDYQIASGGGRQVITMDRYNANVDMVKQGYDCHVLAKGPRVESAMQAVEQFYQAKPRGTDQDIPAFVVEGQDGEALGPIVDGDAVILTNFRGDRAMEISRALEQINFAEFDRGILPDLYFTSIIEYDGDLHIPQQFLVSPPIIERTMGEYLCAQKLRSFAVSETQKFGHVTYFWNGNRSGYVCEELETYQEIKSDVIPFDQAPLMKAEEITQATIDLLKQPDMKFGRINFANGDMVGHTGNFDATVEALEAVDRCVQTLIEAVEKLEGMVMVLADHGNAEEMLMGKGDSKTVKTSHTLNPVPFAIIDGQFANEYKMRKDIDTPSLVNIASTVFNLLGYEAPHDYQPTLLDFK